MLLNRLCWTLIAVVVLAVFVLGKHLSWAMWIATFAYLLMCVGVRFRGSLPLHPILMLLAIGIDLTMVLVLQLQRNAIQTALAFDRPVLHQIHIGVSVAATLLYLPLLALGLRLWLRPPAPVADRIHRILGYTAFVFRSLGFVFMFSMIKSSPASTTQRLAVFPTSDLPVTAPVTILWDKYQIPFIDAQNEPDAAFALGMVHAHLRLGQMEILKRLSAGRVSEMGGPFTVKVDQTLRILNLGHAAAEIEKNLPNETRVWLQRYVEGINTYQQRMPTPPPEFALLSIRVEPWQIHDVIRLSRLAGADVSWMRLLTYFFLKKEKGFDDFWKRYSDGRTLSAAWDPLAAFAKTGSNAFVLSGKKTATHAPLIANDPHLGFSLPNFWVIVGIQCPTLHAVGFTIPGVPFVALGRNPDIAWGGTNLHALSSDLVEVAPDEKTETQTQNISVRGWRDAESQVSWTKWGPLVSDVPFLKDVIGPRKIVLRWTGHYPSDEITAFLKANRAKTSDAFVRAFETYGVSGQNILFAARTGEIGQVYAVAVPKGRPPLGTIPWRKNNGQDLWKEWVRSRDLPLIRNPSDGILVSSNDPPPFKTPSVGEFFSPPQRAKRLRQLLTARHDWDSDKARQVQQDVYSESSWHLKVALVDNLRPLLKEEWKPWFTELENWDGYYSADSRGALVYQALASQTIREFYSDKLGPKLVDFLMSVETGQDYVREDLTRKTADFSQALQQAADSVAKQCGQSVWGDRHRMALGHLLANAPLLGELFIHANFAAPGSIETVTKSAHALGAAKHTARYGAQARHISDLSDPDANGFVLLGGQDGWWGSENFVDQVPVWRKGELVRVPLRKEAFAKQSVAVQRLLPRAR